MIGMPAKDNIGAGIVRRIGKNVSDIEVGDPVLLSFYSCSSCWQCKNSHPAYCTSFAQANYVGEQQFVSARDRAELLGSSFFGQSSFAEYTIVKYSSIVKVKELLHHDEELKLFSPLGCGFQTGMGAIQNITSAGPDDIVMIQGLGAVGMGALMVRVYLLSLADLYALSNPWLTTLSLFYLDCQNSKL